MRQPVHSRPACESLTLSPFESDRAEFTEFGSISLMIVSGPSHSPESSLEPADLSIL